MSSYCTICQYFLVQSDILLYTGQIYDVISTTSIHYRTMTRYVSHTNRISVSEIQSTTCLNKFVLGIQDAISLSLIPNCVCLHIFIDPLTFGVVVLRNIQNWKLNWKILTVVVEARTIDISINNFSANFEIVFYLFFCILHNIVGQIYLL